MTKGPLSKCLYDRAVAESGGLGLGLLVGDRSPAGGGGTALSQCPCQQEAEAGARAGVGPAPGAEPGLRKQRVCLPAASHYCSVSGR